MARLLMDNLKKCKSICVLLVLSMSLVFATGCSSEDENAPGKEYYFQAPDVASDECVAPSFPSETFVINSNTNTLVTGELQLKINKMEIFDNLNDANISPNDVTANHVSYSFTNGRDMFLMYPYYFDGETGQLVDDCYLFMFEAEITNVDAEYKNPYDETQSTCFELLNIFSLHDFSYDSNEGTLGSGGVAYFAEGRQSETSGHDGMFDLNKGETKTLHFGFLGFDRCESPFTRMGITLGGSGYEAVVYWFDASELIAELKNK